MDVDTQAWSGEGDFTVRLLAILEQIDGIAALRVEDAPASRSGTGYAFLANEIFVRFATRRTRRPARRFGVLPGTRVVETPMLTLAALQSRLAGIEGIGAADYVDDQMIQYLRTRQVVAPYQTRGYKLVEMVRLY
jgi:hypothetical protein